MLKVLEISWLLVTLCSGVFAVIKILSEGLHGAVFILMLTGIALGFYLYRRKQRIRQEQVNSEKPE